MTRSVLQKCMYTQYLGMEADNFIQLKNNIKDVLVDDVNARKKNFANIYNRYSNQYPYPSFNNDLYNFLNAIFKNSQINLEQTKNILKNKSSCACSVVELKNLNKIELKQIDFPSRPSSAPIGRPSSQRSKLGGNIKTIKVVKQY